MFYSIVFPFQTVFFAVADIIWEDEASRCCEFTDGENSPRFFPYDIPALKFGLYFTGTAAETAAANFSVSRRNFSGSTQLTPLFFRFNVVNPLFFGFNAVSATIFQVKRR